MIDADRYSDLYAELDRRQRVIDNLREQLAAADAEVKRLRAFAGFFFGDDPEPDDAIAAWDETGRGAG